MKYFLFDIGHVLVNFDYEAFLDAVSNDTGHPCGPLQGRDLDMHDAVETGRITDAQWVDYLNRSLGLAWTLDDLTQLWSRMFSINEAGCALFSEARQAGVSVYTLSNIAKHHIDAIENNWHGFFDGTAGMFLSYRIGVRKPHPQIYRHVLGELGADGSQCFFIDDRPENIAAARSFGIQAHQYLPDNHGATRDLALQFFDW